MKRGNAWRRGLSLTVTAALLGTVCGGFPMQTSAAGESGMIGDLDMDGILTAADFGAMKQILLGKEPGALQKLQADVNADGAVDAADAEMFADYLLTKIAAFPAADVVTVPDEKPETSVRYWAVEAVGENGWEESTNEGFEGAAYWNYANEIGSALTWTVDAPADGNYKVTFRYANGGSADDLRTLQISVNGASESVRVGFPYTERWTAWGEQSVVLTLKAGKNTIRTAAAGTGGGPNMDYLTLEPTDEAPAQMQKEPEPGALRVENLNRGVVAANTNKGILVTWRILGTDDAGTSFKVFKNGNPTPIYQGTTADASCYLDASGTTADNYTVDVFQGGTCTEFACAAQKLTNFNTGTSGAYMDIPMDPPADMTMPDGSVCSYTVNDCSVGDIDGDGTYELFVKWDPSNSQDNSKGGYTGNVYLDCWRLDGKRVWRIDLGRNVRAGAHYTQYLVYDFDGDNCAELICKTSDGTKDGTGKVIGNGNADYRASSGYILTGNEYLTLFDGKTGAALDTVNYEPGRGNVSDWGDNYGNRVDRFTACVAYLGGSGQNASACFGRGYYTRAVMAAWDVAGGKLVKRWVFDTGYNKSTPGYGDGNHHCLAADVDGDGKQEVVYGSGIIDDNGKLYSTTGLAHGDAIHIGDFVPENPGIEIFQCLEDKSHPNGTAVNFGTILRDAKTNKVLFRETAGGDTGRALADNIIAGNSGAEMVGSHNGVVYDCVTGNKICDWSSITKWGQNSVVYWDGTLERGVLDRTMVDKYGSGRIFTGNGVTYNNYTKSNASLTCDLFGDWREEMIFRLSEGSGVRIFTTTYSTEYGIVTLMHDPQYRVQVAAQNNGYNQPPHLSYFLGTGFEIPKSPAVYTTE